MIEPVFLFGPIIALGILVIQRPARFRAPILLLVPAVGMMFGEDRPIHSHSARWLGADRDVEA